MVRPPRIPLDGSLVYGADYYPEQWPEHTWAEDLKAMREAGVNLVNLATFSWALIQPSEDEFRFGKLDRIMDMCQEAGVSVSLATPTAAPPAWFLQANPEVLPVTADGVTLWQGARESFCPSSGAYRAAAATVAAAMARRYAGHPALVTWHINNEYGAHVQPCCCDRSAVAFRGWLKRRYGTPDRLNEEWGTVFWGQLYHDWSQIMPPRKAPMPVNTAQRLDFMRFSNDEYMECYRAEEAVLREITPQVPVTTNFMVGEAKRMDYWRWSRLVDFVGTSSYLVPDDPMSHVGLAFSADLTRSVARGFPWLLMEHSTGAVNWRPRNVAKIPGQMRRNSLAHIGRGSEGVMFFQWRASRFGSEKFHSAMLPQAGRDSAVFRDVVALGADVRALAELRGSQVRADVAIAWDWESWWALEFEDKPTVDLAYKERVREYYEAIWRRNVTVDFVHPGEDLGGYRVLVIPGLYLMSDESARNVRDFVAGGGTVLASYFSGIVDEFDRIHEGPFPGGLAEVLGLHVEEFHPLAEGRTVTLANGATGDIWSERVVPGAAEPVTAFASGPDAGQPALTRHEYGQGRAWYLAARLTGRDLGPVVATVLEEAGITLPDLPDGVEAVRRHGDAGEYLFLINHDTDASVTVKESGLDLLTGTRHEGAVDLPPSGVAVLKR